MNQKGASDLNELLDGINTKIGEFTEAIKVSYKQLDGFSTSIDKKIVSLSESIASLTDVIKKEDEILTQNLHDIVSEVKDEVRSFKEDINVSEIKDVLGSLQKLVKIPEKGVINKTVDKVVQEIFEITKELKGKK